MVRMPGFQQRPGSEPPGAGSLSVCGKIPHTVHEVIPLFDDISPCRPDGGLLRKGQQVAEGFSVFRVKGGIARWLHVIRPGGPLGIDIEHEETVVAVIQCDPLGGLEGWIQRIRRGGRGVDPYADQGLQAAGSQNVTVLGIGMGNIEPAVYVVIRRWLQSGLQSRFKQLQRDGVRGSFGNMGHGKHSLS